MSFSEQEDRTHQGQVQRLVKVTWSRERAWHGEKIFVRVRTENVADDIKAEVKIFVDGTNALVDTLPELTIKDSAADHEYTIDWKDKDTIAKDDRLFYLKAKLKLDQEIASADSPSLHVDLDPPVFSF